jgi:hypothetical protein
MTEVNVTAQDAATVKVGADVLGFYKGAAENPLLPAELRAAMIGAEIEQTVYRTADLRPLDGVQGNALAQAGRQAGLAIHREPSTTLAEVVTAPFTPENLDHLLQQADERFAGLYALARAQGAALAPFGHLPHLRAEEHAVTQVPRYKAFWDPPRADMMDIYRSFLYPNIQTSVSYRDADHLLRIIRLCTALEPFLFLLTDASAGIFEGAAIDYCPWLHMKSRRGMNGDAPGFYYTAKTGAEFIDAHVEHTLNAPYLFVYFDAQNELQRLEAGRFISFSQLENLGLGPQNFLNYRQAQSENWRRICNIAAINDADGGVLGHRAETNLFNSGLQHQRATAILLMNLIAFNDAFYEEVKALLLHTGIDLENLDRSRNILDKNFQALSYHKNQFHALPFGNAALKDFALRFADLVESAYNGKASAARVAPLLHILRSGRPDWLVYREMFPAMADIRTYLERFPELAAGQPELISSASCADMTAPAIAKMMAA